MPLKTWESALGCLYIDELVPGRNDPSGPFLFQGLDGRGQGIDCCCGRALWGQLQIAIQELRSRCDLCGIVARGTGCAAALALAEQLPVDRLALWEPVLSIPRGPGEALRQARRLAAYARRNLSLCVADTLVLDRGPKRLVGWSARCRLSRVELPGEGGDKMYTIREIASNIAVSRFLHTGELPKTLDFPEWMCIIDG